jgi:hypothetical protein
MLFAENNNLAFIETSALDATGVEEAFRQILSGKLRPSLSLPLSRLICPSTKLLFQKFTGL